VSPEPVRTVVHLLRHGEVFNPDGILYGRLPGFRLSENGTRQAKIVAAALADADIAAVLASPMQRAQETAAPVAAAHRLEIRTEDRLIEADNKFEGERVSVGDGALRSPRFWPLLTDPFTPSWGEPYLRIAHRMFGAAHRARELAAGREAVCVSHQLPIWTLRRFVTGRRLWHDPRSRQCGLASLTSLVFADTELTGVYYTEPAGASDPLQTGA
jgi:broad specificity phosphatase PhoE